MLKIMVTIILSFKGKVGLNMLQVNSANCIGLKDFKLNCLSHTGLCVLSSEA